MEIHPVTLEGARALLVPLSEDHVPGLYAISRHPEIWAYLTLGYMPDLDGLTLYVKQALAHQAEGTELPFTIIDKTTGGIAGTTRYMDILLPHRLLEIGSTWLTPSVWRTRLNTECKYLLLTHAFETLGAVRVQLKTDLRNVRSQKAIERLGAVKEGVLRKHRIMGNGYIRDSVMYSITGEEWPAVKARLEGFLQKDG